MAQNKRGAATVFLIVGIAFLAIGIGTDNTAFSSAAIAFVVLALILGGRWMRPPG